jgi:hypothetical protein
VRGGCFVSWLKRGPTNSLLKNLKRKEKGVGGEIMTCSERLRYPCILVSLYSTQRREALVRFMFFFVGLSGTDGLHVKIENFQDLVRS